MLDRKFIVENAEQVKENCQNRGVHGRRRPAGRIGAGRRDEATRGRRAQPQRQRSVQVDRQSQGCRRTGSCARKRAASCANKKTKFRRKSIELDQESRVAGRYPQHVAPRGPIGADDKANLELRRGRHAYREFDFPISSTTSNWARQLDLIDFEGGARIAGHGFYFLKNEAVLLELALQQFATHLLIDEGFTPVITPDLAYTEILQGTGYIPRGPETQIYSIENSNLNLVATAENHSGRADGRRGPRCGTIADQALRHQPLFPHRSRRRRPCLARALSRPPIHQGRDVRLHAAGSERRHAGSSSATWNADCSTQLGIPYRVVDTATGDLGGPAYRKFDLEAWMPGRGEGGEWGEVTSTSNCTDYQARRLNIRYKRKAKKGTQLVHTLNGTAIAISRALIAILENYQQADGSFRVPTVLQPYVGSEVVAPR